GSWRPGRWRRPLLNQARKHADGELARRAGLCIQAIEQQTGGGRTVSAVRVLAERKPAGTIEVLLAFLPCAADEAVEDEIRLSLLALGLKDGKAVAELEQALTDTEPTRRGGAGYGGRTAREAGPRRALPPL